MNDSISDLLIRLKNGSMANNKIVSSPHSIYRESIVKLLQEQGFIAGYKVDVAGKHKVLVISLLADGIKTIRLEVVLISKPGRRLYATNRRLDKYTIGLGSVVISTPKGIMTVKQAKKAQIGGELLFRITKK